jgi:hypothetical protein
VKCRFAFGRKPHCQISNGMQEGSDLPLVVSKSLKLLQYVLSYCIAMASKKRVVLGLNAKVKVVGASERDKLTMKHVVGKFKTGKTQVYYILKSKLHIKQEWLTGNGSMKMKLTRLDTKI